MPKFADNHATDAVPESELISGFRIAQISVGVTITLPAFLVAAQIFTSLGFTRGLIALGATGFLLSGIAGLTMVSAARTRLSTYSIIQSVFGRWVAIAINVLLAIVMLGWFAVTISIFAAAFAGSLSHLANVTAPTWLVKAMGGVAMTLLTLYGFKAIDRFARIIVPLLALVLIAAFVSALSDTQWGDLTQMNGDGVAISTIGAGVSIMIGAFMAGVAIAPDIARFVKTQRQGVVAGVLSYGIGAQLVFILAGVPALISGNTDFVSTLLTVGFGWPALFVVVFATITTNISNLYSVSLSMRQVVTGVEDFQMTAFVGIIGTITALAGIENLFIPFLLFLGVAIPPIAGVYVVQIFLCGGIRENSDQQNFYWRAVAAWALGSFVAYLSTQSLIALTGAAALDGFLVGALAYFLSVRVGARRGDGG